ncbi:DUF6766 family protein [Mesorhizobium sp. AR10]|uniref:DUF6766 family protein n=1 Tax=Mesorhizobium sp. AR10 TaxID=2865839 RepID=UPI0029E8061B|nr:DUF6766 family protein [Mesorhizobium sp. AR10]
MFSMLGMIWSGWRLTMKNSGITAHKRSECYPIEYRRLSALFENWESEFLQMSAYVMLTAMLFQRGWAESRDPDDPHRPDDKLGSPTRRLMPMLSWLYSYSLGIALALLFIVSFACHWWMSLAAADEEALRHGGQIQSLGPYLLDAKLWFESFQNWQSEFMSTAFLVVLSIDTKARRNRRLSVQQTPTRAHSLRYAPVQDARNVGSAFNQSCHGNSPFLEPQLVRAGNVSRPTGSALPGNWSNAGCLIPRIASEFQAKSSAPLLQRPSKFGSVSYQPCRPYQSAISR